MIAAEWYNNRRLLQAIGDIPPADKDLVYYRQQARRPSRLDSNKTVPAKIGAIHRDPGS